MANKNDKPRMKKGKRDFGGPWGQRMHAEYVPSEELALDELRLPIDLIPKTTWGVNVRTILDDKQLWEELRIDALDRSHHLCTYCRKRFTFHAAKNRTNFHAHEVWEYDDHTDPDHPVQRLTDIVAVCPACHESAHMGRAHAIGRFSQAMRHMQGINRMTEEQAKGYIDRVFIAWQIRSEMTWEVQIDWAIERLKELESTPNTKGIPV